MIRRHWRPPESRVPGALLAAFLPLLLTAASTLGRTAPSQNRAPLRIPLADGANPCPGYSTQPVTEDPLCTSGCIIPVSSKAKVPALWSKGGVTYAAVDATMLNDLRNAGQEVSVVWPRRDTEPLYVLSKVRDDQELLVSSQGQVHDSSSDVRLIMADREPFAYYRAVRGGDLGRKAPAFVRPAGRKRELHDRADPEDLRRYRRHREPGDARSGTRWARNAVGG